MATASVERMKRLQAGKSRTKMARSEWKLLLQSVVNHRTRFLPAWKTKPRWSKPVLRGRSRPEANGGAVRVGKTWRSRKGGAWMAEPCMLERRGGAGKVVLGWWSRVWEQTLAEAEPQKLGLDGGAVRVGKTWRSRKGGAWMAEPCLLGTEGGAGTQLDEVWKAKPKSTKENTRTTKGSEDGRHKHLRKQNISCQKENKSLETIVFSAETNVLRKRLKQHEKTNTVPQWWKGLFFRKKPKFA